MFSSSVSGSAPKGLGFIPSSIVTTIDGIIKILEEDLDSNGDDKWNTFIFGIDIPPSETMLTDQTSSTDKPPLDDPGFPVSFSWIAATLSVPKRMNSDGRIINTSVTQSFELPFNLATPNNLQVNWDGGNNFHLTTLNSTSCDDLTTDQRPPVVPINTFNGAGRYNNVDGATIEFVLVDVGETDSKYNAAFLIKDINGEVVLDVSGALDNRGRSIHQGLENDK